MAKIAIIGGAVIASSIADYLALAGHAADVVVIEPGPAYERVGYQRILDDVPLQDEVPKS